MVLHTVTWEFRSRSFLQLQNSHFPLLLSSRTLVSFLAQPLWPSDLCQMVSAPFHTVINCTAFDLITCKSHSTWQGLWGKCHLCAWRGCPGESPLQFHPFNSYWEIQAWHGGVPHLPCPLLRLLSNRSQNRQEQTSSHGSFFSGCQWSSLANASAWEVAVNFQACFIALLPFYGFRGWEQDERQWEHKLHLRVSQGHRVLRLCRNIILKQKHTLVLCTLILAVVQSWEISITEIPRLTLVHNCFCFLFRARLP